MSWLALSTLFECLSVYVMRLRSLWILYYIIAEIDFGRQNKMSKDIPALILLLFVEIDYAPVWKRSDEGLGYRLGWPLLCQQIFLIVFHVILFFVCREELRPCMEEKRWALKLNYQTRRHQSGAEMSGWGASKSQGGMVQRRSADGDRQRPNGKIYTASKNLEVRSIQQVNI